MEQVLSSPVVKSFLAGSFSGTCSTLLFQPLDLVKTRIQQSPVTITNGTSDGMIHIFNTVVKNDRVVGLWRGIVPSITRVVPGVGIYFSSLHWLRTNFGSKDPRSIESMLFGAGARSFAAVSTIPFTVLKTRYESGSFKYGNMSKALVIVYQTEGVRGLYSGLSATLLRDVPFSGLYLMFYTNLKKYIPKDQRLDTALPLMQFSCGILAGALASFITQPSDVVKTNMQLNPQKFTRLLQVAQYILERDGLMGFWRGIVPRTLRRTLMAAMAWTVYEQVMRDCGVSANRSK